jgi:hypothetical protein
MGKSSDNRIKGLKEAAFASPVVKIDRGEVKAASKDDPV